MIQVAIISSSIIDRGTFMPAAKQVTGENHVTGVDARPGRSRLADDMSIIRDFAGDAYGLESSVIFLGVLAAGLDEFMFDFLAICGMSYVPTSKAPRGVRAVVVSGSVEQWRVAIQTGLTVRGPVQAAFMAIRDQMTQLGLDGATTYLEYRK